MPTQRAGEGVAKRDVPIANRDELFRTLESGFRIKDSTNFDAT